MKITFGTDPEFVLTSKGKAISAIPVLKRGKDDRIDLGDGYNYYYDNVLLEANVAPAIGQEQARTNVQSLFDRIYNTLSKDYDIKAQASAIFAEHECDHVDARAAGCSPEYCAYEVEQVMPPEFTGGFRSAGGHIHIGRDDWKNPSDDFLIDVYSKMDVIKAMDVFVGLPSILIDSNEPSKDRKKLYGQAGRHRPTDYGVEYRTISNYWLSSPELVNITYTLTMHAVDMVRNNTMPEVDFDKVRAAINNNDFELANELCLMYIPKELLDQVNQFVNWNSFDIKSNWGI